jgi:hypothetical protein
VIIAAKRVAAAADTRSRSVAPDDVAMGDRLAHKPTQSRPQPLALGAKGVAFVSNVFEYRERFRFAARELAFAMAETSV